jgi:hypothetical protein
VPVISGGSAGGALSGVTVSGTAASGQVPVASSSSAGAWAYPPDYEINYTARTTNLTIASTTEATGTTVLSPGAITFDGTPVWVEFFAASVQVSTASVGSAVGISLFEGATQITRLVWLNTFATSGNTDELAFGRYRFTPTAAAHTYTVTVFAQSTTGTPTIIAGSGGTNGFPPCYVRFVKA